VVDPLGRVVASLPLGSEGVLDARLPRPVAPALYARAGDSIAGVMVALALVCVIRSRRRLPRGLMQNCSALGACRRFSQ
jgi:apolipoprotein N-acyltransferase